MLFYAPWYRPYLMLRCSELCGGVGHANLGGTGLGFVPVTERTRCRRISHLPRPRDSRSAEPRYCISHICNYHMPNNYCFFLFPSHPRRHYHGLTTLPAIKQHLPSPTALPSPSFPSYLHPKSPWPPLCAARRTPCRRSTNTQ